MDIHYTIYKNGEDATGGSFQRAVASPNWTAVVIPVSNPDYESADSARIMISAFNPDNGFLAIQGNTVLYIDNLSFDTLISAVHENMAGLNGKTNLFYLYPSLLVNF
jgi:hypothetical protein